MQYHSYDLSRVDLKYGCHYSCFIDLCYIFGTDTLKNEFKKYLTNHIEFRKEKINEKLWYLAVDFDKLNKDITEFFNRNGILITQHQTKHCNNVFTIKKLIDQSMLPFIIYDQYYDPNSVLYGIELNRFHYAIVYGYNDHDKNIYYKDYRVNENSMFLNFPYDYLEKAIGAHTIYMKNYASINTCERLSSVNEIYIPALDFKRREVNNDVLLKEYCMFLNSQTYNDSILSENYLSKLADFIYLDFRTLKILYNEMNQSNVACKLSDLSMLCNTMLKLRYSKKQRDLIKLISMLNSFSQ